MQSIWRSGERASPKVLIFGSISGIYPIIWFTNQIYSNIQIIYSKFMIIL